MVGCWSVCKLMLRVMVLGSKVICVGMVEAGTSVGRMGGNCNGGGDGVVEELDELVGLVEQIGVVQVTPARMPS